MLPCKINSFQLKSSLHTSDLVTCKTTQSPLINPSATKTTKTTVKLYTSSFSYYSPLAFLPHLITSTLENTNLSYNFVTLALPGYLEHHFIHISKH